MLPVGIFVVALVRFFVLENHYSELFFSMLFLGLVLLGLFLYVSVKSRKLINPIDSFIGLGDIVFFVAILPLFYMTTYLVFFSTGMLFSIVCHLLFTKDKEAHVPLAGYLSIYLLLALFLDFYLEKELFYTHIII
jgi:hypothetical protein